MQRWLGSTASVFACLLALAVSFSARAQSPCDADVNGDGVVDGADLSVVLNYWGQVCLAPTPTISSVAPNSGSTAGGDLITITGTNLTGAKSVTIGGVAA
ncbi:MAG: IPT/TIG domain-containing protein, partial [Planctomycetaceae bacterium]|nr:IPT/TIG domain-containing protein [Planctomycetaceae bacterium]